MTQALTLADILIVYRNYISIFLERPPGPETSIDAKYFQPQQKVARLDDPKLVRLVLTRSCQTYSYFSC